MHMPSNKLQEIIRYLGLTFICMALIRMAQKFNDKKLVM